LVQNADYAYTALLRAVEHNLPSDLEPAQPWLNRVAGSANRRIARQQIEAIF